MATAIAQQPIRPRLLLQYQTEFVKVLQKELKLKNVNQVPSLEKIVINVGLGRVKENKKAMEVAINT
ncbi:MAG: 50S ribosomal protein L5, partial [Candidatus Saccharimonadales bacterium]